MLEVFEVGALLLRRLLQLFHGVELHVLTDLVQPLHYLCVTGDAKLFCFLDQQLLIDQVTQQVLLAFGHLRVGRRNSFLLRLVQQLLAVARQLGARDDVVVHAGNDLFHHAVGEQGSRKNSGGKNGCEGQYFSHDEPGTFAGF